MSLLPKSIHRCRRYPTKFNSGRDIPPVAATPISITSIGTSGGNPGGETVWQVSNLMPGDAFNLNWFYEVEITEQDLVILSAEAMVKVDTLTENHLVLDIMMLTNTSATGNGIRLTSFGLAVGGFDSLDVPSSTPGLDLTFLSDVIPPPIPGFVVDVCASSGTNCAGGAGGGIVVSDFDDFTFDIDGTFDPNNLTVSQFALKFQTGLPTTGEGNSFELPGHPSPKPAPEPSSTLLLGLGLTGLGYWNKRRKRRPSAN